MKAGGASTPVTNSNRIEYIHLVADYKLNRQIRAQCAAFRGGLTRVIPLEWVHMFNSKELQVLIAGAEVRPISGGLFPLSKCFVCTSFDFVSTSIVDSSPY